MNRQALCLILCAIVSTSCARNPAATLDRTAPAAAATSRQDVPDLGIILNDDGDLLFLHDTAEASIRATRESLDAMRGTPIRTLTLCVGAGSDILHYPTKVADIYGWRETKSTRKFEKPKNEEEMWHPRIVKERSAILGGADLIREAGSYARDALGMRFFPSFRMNDDHFMFDPLEYPLTGSFWMKNHERMKMGTDRSPILSDEHYGNLLDFTHEEVRAYRLATIREVIERYGDISDGLELDFNRVQMFFPRGTAHEHAPLLTQMVRDVRAMLDDAGRKHGRNMILIARVPPTLANCAWSGMEVETWIDERLIDVIVPSQLMTISHDMRVDQFTRLAHPRGVKVYPSLYPRTSYQWPFTMTPTAAHYATPSSRNVNPALVRGAVATHRLEGADGFQLFNFHHEDLAIRPFSDRFYRILRDLAGPEAIATADKTYAVTPAFYLDYEDSFEYAKQLPATLSNGTPLSVTIFIADDLQSPSARDVPPTVALRVGLTGWPDGMTLQASINGHPVGTPFTKADAIEAKGSHARGNSGTFFVQRTIDEHRVLRRGANKLTFAATNVPPSPATQPTTNPKDLQRELAKAPARVAEAQVGVIYDRKYLELLYK